MDGFANLVPCLLQALYAVSTDQPANSLVSIFEWSAAADAD